MSHEDFSDAALILIGHGTTQNPESSAPVYQHTTELRRRGVFAEVHESFWKQEPQVQAVVNEALSLEHGRVKRIFLAPLFISEGYFSEHIIPEALGFHRGETELVRVQEREHRELFYCRAVGSHDSMTEVLLARAREVVQRFPFPRAPGLDEITLFIAGHGTEEDPNSRTAIERQAELIAVQEIYAGVHAVFLDEEPRIAMCYQMAQTRNIVMVPFFISDGLHVREDIPVLLGEPERIVQARLAQGQPTWRNPTEKQGKLVWYSPSVGTDTSIANVILERVREASHWRP